MLNLRTFLIVCMTSSVSLSACTSATPPQTLIPPSPGPTLASVTSNSDLESLGTGVPVIEYVGEHSRFVVISPVTGKPLDVFTPIPTDNNYNYAFAPDGHTLALVTDGQLYFIDLPSGKYHMSPLDLHGWISTVAYSSDGNLLAVAGGAADGALRVIDAKSGNVNASTQAGFSIRNIQFTTDGKGLMAYGPQLASTGVAANAGVSVGAPKAASFAASDLTVLWSVKLDGIRDGTFPKDADASTTQDIYQPGAAWHYQPGIAFAPGADVLYLVHGDEDKLTTIDFAKQKVNTVDLYVKTTWFDQLLEWTAGVAHAKGADGTSKQAVISADGKSLYVVGTTDAYSKNSTGNWDVTQTFVGLQVIATEDGSIVDQQDSDAYSVAQSSDGKYLLLMGWQNNTGTSWTEVYEIASHKIIRRIGSVTLTPTRRVDGTPILVSSEYFGNNLCHLASVDSSTWTIASDWKSDCVGWLMDPK